MEQITSFLKENNAVTIKVRPQDRRYKIYPNKTEIDWNVIEFEESGVLFNVTFAYPQSITPKADLPDEIEVTFNKVKDLFESSYADRESIPEGFFIRKSLPPQ